MARTPSNPTPAGRPASGNSSRFWLYLREDSGGLGFVAEGDGAKPDQPAPASSMSRMSSFARQAECQDEHERQDHPNRCHESLLPVDGRASPRVASHRQRGKTSEPSRAVDLDGYHAHLHAVQGQQPLGRDDLGRGAEGDQAPSRQEAARARSAQRKAWSGSWVEKSTVSPRAARPRRAESTLLLGHHHVGSLDHGPRRVPHGQTEVVDGFVRDGGHDDEAVPEVDPHVGSGGALLHLDDPSLELIASTELHGFAFSSGGSGGSGAKRPSIQPSANSSGSTWPDAPPSHVRKYMCTSLSPGVKTPVRG